MKKITKHLMPGNVAIAFVGLLAGALVSITGVFGGSVTALSTWFLLHVLQRRYMAALDARMKADLSMAWTVWLNGVRAGEIPDSEFAKIRYRVMTSPTAYTRQIGNLLTTLFNAWFRVSGWVLVFAFWVVLAWSYADPTAPAQLIEGLKSPEGVRNVTTLFMVVFLLELSFIFLLGVSLQTFGWSNEFRKETGRYLRYFFESQAVDAEYVIGRFTEEGVLVRNDEMRYVTLTRPTSPPSAINID